MPYTVSIDRRAAKFLRSLKDARLAARLRGTIDELSENPRHLGTIKLQGPDDLYRVRVGDYRIIYQIQDSVLVVLVVEIGHRRDIYRV